MPRINYFRGRLARYKILGVNSFMATSPGKGALFPMPSLAITLISSNKNDESFQTSAGMLSAHAIKEAPRYQRRRGPFSGETQAPETES